MKRFMMMACLIVAAAAAGCASGGASGGSYDHPDVVISKAPATRVHEPPARVRKAAHVHGATCGCAWDRRERVWVVLEEGHVHGRNCGHININGKWCLPR